MKYLIRINKKGTSFEMNFPLLSFEDDFWMLQELNRCDADYILDDILPNLEKIRNGELYWDPYRSPHYGYYDFYGFGYDATIIFFYKDKSIITYNYFEDEIEVPSEDIYCFMKEWGEYLREWKNKQETI